MNQCSDFWNVLAPFHAEVEDTNFDLASVRRLLPEIHSPVLVVGAGHGLIVGELREQGYECDGVDRNEEMIRQARLRRGIALIPADSKAMALPTASYETIIYATGVVDFTAEDDEIRAMLTEGRRVVRGRGRYSSRSTGQALRKRVFWRWLACSAMARWRFARVSNFTC